MVTSRKKKDPNKVAKYAKTRNSKKLFAELYLPYLKKGEYVLDYKVAVKLLDLWYSFSKDHNLESKEVCQNLFTKMFENKDLLLHQDNFKFNKITDSRQYWPGYLTGKNQQGSWFTIDLFIQPDNLCSYGGQGLFTDTDISMFGRDGNIRDYSTRVENVDACRAKMFMKGKNEKTTTLKRFVVVEEDGVSKEIAVTTNEQLDYEGAEVALRVPNYGIELEALTRKTSPENITDLVLDDLDGAAILKSDGSIGRFGCSGFEIVSVPATFQAHKESLWKKFFENSAKYLRSWNTGSCGLHVHVSRIAFTKPHLARFASFINSPVTRAFIEDVAGRGGNSYCSFDTDLTNVARINQYEDREPVFIFAGDGEELTELEQSQIWEGDDGQWFHGDPDDGDEREVEMDEETQRRHDRVSNNRRTACNLCNLKTVEVRIFRGNTKKAGFFKCLEFVDALFYYTRLNSNTGMSTLGFVEWIQRNNNGYGNLTKWLQAHDYIATRNNLNIDWRKECA